MIDNLMQTLPAQRQAALLRSIAKSKEAIATVLRLICFMAFLHYCLPIEIMPSVVAPLQQA